MGLKNSATAAAAAAAASALRPPPLFYLTFSIFFSVFFFFSVCALLTTITTTRTTCFDIKCSLNADGGDLYFQQRTHVDTSPNEGEQKKKMMGSEMMSRGRRHLSGPGSSPPRCTSKCGKCRPCKPVHVAVPPGTPVTAEYYPEAWRCKCGNKLYMP